MTRLAKGKHTVSQTTRELTDAQFLPKTMACKLLLFVVIFELVVDLTIEVSHPPATRRGPSSFCIQVVDKRTNGKLI